MLMLNGLHCDQVGTSGRQGDVHLQWQILGDTPRPRVYEREPAEVVVKPFPTNGPLKRRRFAGSVSTTCSLTTFSADVYVTLESAQLDFFCCQSHVLISASLLCGQFQAVVGVFVVNRARAEFTRIV